MLKADQQGKHEFSSIELCLLILNDTCRSLTLELA